MSSANKKQRHEAKRKAKRKETRRRVSGSPLKRLADARGEVECWISEDDDGNRQRQIFAFKRAAGLSGVVCFLVDRGVVGLKDAWSRMGIEAEDREYMLGSQKLRGFSMIRIDVEEARRWVAGAARWAHDNGMRLPKDWIKCASLIGGVGDWQSADVKEFVKEFVGHPEDLRQRLIGEPYAAYLKRKDIDFDFDESAPYMDQATGDYENNDDAYFDDLEDLDADEAMSMLHDLPDESIDMLLSQFTTASHVLVTQTTSWLAARGEIPSPELFEGWRTVMLSGTLASAAIPDGDADEIATLSADLIMEIVSRVGLDRLEAHEQGISQALVHLTSDPQIVKKAILQHGLDEVELE